MLNGKALSGLLSSNSDERLCKCWFLLTLNGTVLASSQQTDIQDLRRRAAVATLSWQEHEGGHKGDTAETDGDHQHPANAGPLHTLTIESESSNLMIRKIQPQLLLVLEGGVPPRKHTVETRVTRECVDGAVEPSNESGRTELVVGSSISSASGSTKTKTESAVLELQRRKLNALATAIVEDLEATGFRMPESSLTKLF